MNIGRLARILAMALTLIVLIASASYLLIYLYRWEWNRALVAGLFFVAAEVALIGTMVLRRMDGMVRSSGRVRSRGALAERPATPMAERRAPFAWLDKPEPWTEDDDVVRTHVFIPVLLGAGVVLSAIAHVVQRIAGASTSEASLDGRATPPIADLAPVEGGLVPPPGGDREAIGLAQLELPPRGTPRWNVVVNWILAVAIGVALLVTAIDVIADATQARPDIVPTGWTTVIGLEIDQRGEPRPVHQVADSLWTACHGRTPEGTALAGLRVVEDDIVILTIEPALGDTGERRLRGCLEDATLDLVDADLLWMDRTRADAVEAGGR